MSVNSTQLNSPQIVLRDCSREQTIYAQAFIENSKHTASLEFDFQYHPCDVAIYLPHHIKKRSASTRSCSMLYPPPKTRADKERYKDIKTVTVHINLPEGVSVRDKRYLQLVFWIQTICNRTFPNARPDYSYIILHSKRRRVTFSTETRFNE